MQPRVSALPLQGIDPRRRPSVSYSDELVNWFNQVDTSYRAEFKDLFEVHFSRVEAKLEQGLAELRAEFDVKLNRMHGELLATLERRLSEQTRWLFGAWALVLASVIGLWFRH